MKVRAKFTCVSKQGEYVSFQPVYSGSEENKSFFKATPNASIQLSTLNQRALDAFEVGKEYYVDFTAAVEGTFDQAAKEGYKNAMEDR